MNTNPSGEQFELSWGDQQATVVEVGGGIRRYDVAGRPVLDPYPLEAICDGAHGTPLVPWPNRLGDGRYSFDGVDYQVALNEPEKNNAIHGFLRWRSWQALQQTSASVTMGTRLYPLQGYPFFLEVEVRYELAETGLTVRSTTSNRGPQSCPYGTGQHPYLSAGHGTIDGCSLQFEAATRILTDDERQLPIGTEAVPGTPYDFAEPREIGATELDYPFTDLKRDGDGRAWVHLTGTDGRVAELWVDEGYPLIELYTGDTLAPGRQRLGLAAEPMTCPPNAFQTGERLIRLEPGQSVTTTWGARLS